MERYQDYVIKDGKFIGKFEEMYKKFENPWQQGSIEDNVHSYSRNFVTSNIRRYGIKSLVEFGCGFGYFTDFIKRTTGIKILGIDISQTAIEKARGLWPNLDFIVDDVYNIENYLEFEAILFAETTLYILPNLDKILDKMYSNFKGKYFFNTLTFYKGQQKYGKEFFTNLKEFIDYIPFKLIGYAEATVVESGGIDTGAIFRIEKK